MRFGRLSKHLPYLLLQRRSALALTATKKIDFGFLVALCAVWNRVDTLSEKKLQCLLFVHENSHLQKVRILLYRSTGG